MANVKVSELARIPIHYDRFRPEDYGQPGHPHAVYMTAGMKTTLEGCFKAMLAAAPKEFGGAKYILTAGAYVSKPGYHGLGRAFDLDGLVWENRHWIADSFPRDPQFYLAIESLVRRHFGTVLTYSYNQPHEDHIHMDDGSSVGFERMSRSRVIYLQNAIYYIYGIKVGRDGVWGPETEAADRMIRDELGIGGLGSKNNWLKFLDVTAKRGFATVIGRDLVG